MPDLIALVSFAFVSSVTPGPNNVLLWASGTRFGFRRSLPHVFGAALGIGAMAVGVAVGIGALVDSVPDLVVAMKAAGSLYLVYLAVQIARSGAIERKDVAKPFGIVGAALFQVVNPKAWVFVLGAISTFRPADDSGIGGSLLVALAMTVVVVPAFALWAGAGGAIGRLVESPRSRRIVSLVLAVILLASVRTVWT